MIGEFSFLFLISEAEDFQPLPAKVALKSNWDDEDVDEDDIKDSWEKEDEPVPPASAVKPATEKAPKKAAAAAKGVEKKAKTVEASKEEPLDPFAEKLRMQRLVEEADYQATAELFGAKTQEQNIDIFIPKSESDFLEYAESDFLEYGEEI
ncbi:hypothetical protein DY000_02033377 [Brassica cretica]|uniref:Eukaryotic translation initiation factor 3 30 kDa subunit n=2 Tax=Brassica TaxID=3705 RepID=A0ABQ7DF26_BRACR|nr:hypothetical protein DY000_02033377 [Brassica cretica]